MDRAFAADVPPPLQRLRRFVELTERAQAGLFEQTWMLPGCPFGNLAAEQVTQDGVLRDKVADPFDRLQAALRDTLIEAVSSAEIAAIDVDATAAAMLAYLEDVILMAKTRNDPVVLAQLVPAMLDIRIDPVSA